jgi:GxxExxY protein
MCLGIEFRRADLIVDAEKRYPVVYDGITTALGYYADFAVENKVIVEVKAIEQLLPIHEAQLMSYLKLSGLRVGLLVNFNVTLLKFGTRRRILGY